MPQRVHRCLNHSLSQTRVSIGKGNNLRITISLLAESASTSASVSESVSISFTDLCQISNHIESSLWKSASNVQNQWASFEVNFYIKHPWVPLKHKCFSKYFNFVEYLSKSFSINRISWVIVCIVSLGVSLRVNFSKKVPQFPSAIELRVVSAECVCLPQNPFRTPSTSSKWVSLRITVCVSLSKCFDLQSKVGPLLLSESQSASASASETLHQAFPVSLKTSEAQVPQ